jgi:hypothetical protein
VLVHEEPADTDVTAGSPELLVPVKVRVLIGEAGRPLSAEALSGPGQLRPHCVQAALRYRWEPLGPHGLEAPIEIIITFHPTVRGRGRRFSDMLPRRL